MKLMESGKMGGRRWTLFGVVAVSCAAAFAGFEQIDGKDYWRDDAGTLHQYLYLKGHTADIGTATFLAQPEDTATTPWVAGSVFVASSNLTYTGSWKFAAPSSVYGICYQTNGVTGSYFTYEVIAKPLFRIVREPDRAA